MKILLLKVVTIKILANSIERNLCDTKSQRTVESQIKLKRVNNVFEILKIQDSLDFVNKSLI